MKVRILTGLLFCCCFVQAQVREKNHIAIDPFVSVFGTVQVQYERAFNENISVGLSVGYKTSSGIFKLSGMETDRITTDDFNFKGIKIIPEFRWYIQKQKLYGFYMGAYLKYQNYTSDIDGIYIDSYSQNHAIDMEGNIETFALGVEIGYKLMIKKRFFIDFIIAGPGVSFNTFELKEKAPIPQAFYNDLSRAISNYGIFEHLDTDFKLNTNHKNETKTLPAFRYGIKLGYVF